MVDKLSEGDSIFAEMGIDLGEKKRCYAGGEQWGEDDKIKKPKRKEDKAP